MPVLVLMPLIWLPAVVEQRPVEDGSKLLMLGWI